MPQRGKRAVRTPHAGEPTSRARQASLWVSGLAVGAVVTTLVSALVTRSVDATLGGPVLSVSAVPEIVECGTSFVFDKPISRISLPDGDWAEWGKRNGGVVSDYLVVSVNVAGKDDRPITLTGISASVVDRRPATRGVVIGLPCGGPVEAPFLAYDLDSDPPRLLSSSIVPRTLEDEEWKLTPMTFPWTITRTDTANLVIYGITAECDCAWTGALTWQSGSRHGKITIDDEGEPFRVSTSAQSTLYEPDLDNPGNWIDLGTNHVITFPSGE